MNAATFLCFKLSLRDLIHMQAMCLETIWVQGSSFHDRQRGRVRIFHSGRPSSASRPGRCNFAEIVVLFATLARPRPGARGAQTNNSQDSRIPCSVPKQPESNFQVFTPQDVVRTRGALTNPPRRHHLDRQQYHHHHNQCETNRGFCHLRLRSKGISWNGRLPALPSWPTGVQRPLTLTSRNPSYHRRRSPRLGMNNSAA